MKHFSQFLMLPALLLAASACSDDVPGTDANNPGEGPQVYMTFKLDNVASTRSQTDGENAWGNSTDGNEVGTDAENKISTVYVFLVPQAGGDAIVSATATTILGPSSDQYYTVSFNQTDIKQHAGKAVNVMVYCNLNSQTVYGANTTVTGNSWGNGGAGEFAMSNADTNFGYTLPAANDLKLYNTPENPCNLGTINVKRAAARFDIKAGSTYNDQPNQYKIDGNENLYIELTDISLVNHSTSWYVQHRVSDNTDGTNTTLCGNEWYKSAVGDTPESGNYVVDTDWTAKNAWVVKDPYEAPAGFEFLSSNRTEEWTWSALTTDMENYTFWRYANENTLPLTKQVHALSTGVVFRGEIKCSATEGDLYNAFTDGENLYVFRNKLYGSIAMVKANLSGNAALKLAYETCVTEVVDGENTTYTVDEDKAKEAGFTIYKANTEGKYYVYYHYWNRHNDNGNATVMAPMEFAVVRNNVYKLNVTGIRLFGSPDPEDPEDPDTPDEQDKVYFNVDVKVLPWVVRINNIEF